MDKPNPKSKKKPVIHDEKPLFEKGRFAEPITHGRSGWTQSYYPPRVHLGDGGYLTLPTPDSDDV